MSKNRIYFDNAASTPLIPEVLNAITETLEFSFGNPSSIHAPGRKARTIIEKSRKIIAGHLKCSIGEIFFSSNATESNNTILSGCVKSLDVNHIIYSAIEHPSVVKAIKMLEKDHGISSVSLPVDQYGNLLIEDFETELKNAKNTKKKSLVSVMYVNNELGTIQDIKSIANMCKTHQVLFHTDAVQAIGKYDINLSELPINFLSASAHKFHGPKGIGFFYMNLDNIIQPLIYGGSQERNMRSGTENTAFIHGMSIAFDMAYQEMEERRIYVQGLRDYLVKSILENLENVDILGNQDAERQQYSICNVSFAPHPRNEMMMMNLDVAGICASGGSACSSGIEYDSPVLEAIQLDKDRTAIRFSLSPMNNKEEIDELIMVLAKLQS